MDTKEFERILNETIIPSTASNEEQVEKIERLYGCAASKMPPMLFRYRKCDERSLDAFYKDKVWISTPESMNDGFDTRLFFDKKPIIEWLNWFESENAKAGLKSFFAEESELPANIAEIPGMEQAFNAIKIAPLQQKDDFIASFHSFVYEDVSAVSEAIASIAQQSLKFCCLSERIDSSAMWGLYSENETGFALAYDCKNLFSDVPLENGFNRTCTCLPIIYSDSRYQVSLDCIQSMIAYRLMYLAITRSNYGAFAPQAAFNLLSRIPLPDKLFATKIALYKSNEWRREEEWRLFCTSSNEPAFQNETHSCFTLKPKAIYLGRRIKPIFEKILTDIAREKAVTIYKMRLDDNSPAYELLPEHIEN